MELGRQIRTELAKRKYTTKESILNARQSDNALFHKLIRKQRAQCHHSIDELHVGNQRYSGDDILSGWYDEHFINLATQDCADSFDTEFINQVGEEVAVIYRICLDSRGDPKFVTVSSVKSLHHGKLVPWQNLGTFGVSPMVPLVILPWIPLATIGTFGNLKTPNGFWLPLTTFLLIVNNEKDHRLLLQLQMDARVPIHNVFAMWVIFIGVLTQKFSKMHTDIKFNKPLQNKKYLWKFVKSGVCTHTNEEKGCNFLQFCNYLLLLLLFIGCHLKINDLIWRVGYFAYALCCLQVWPTMVKTICSLATTMTITNRWKITLTPLRLHSASSVRIPNSINNSRTLIPAVRLRPLNLLSASSVNLHDLANTCIFHNNLRVMLSPLKSPVLRKYSNPFKRPGMYPSISKCNAKRSNCCIHLCTNSTVTSSVNGRKFSVVIICDLDWKSINLI